MRKIIQIAPALEGADGYPASLLALLDDGQLWELCRGEWVQVPLPPPCVTTTPAPKEDTE